MSYESEVLADNPVFYCRLDDGAGSTVMPDISPSASDGTYYSGTGFGLASPIQTDPSSRAIGTHIGFVRVEDESLGTFTWEAWGLYTPSLVAAALITRGGQIGLSASNYIGINSNAAAAQVSVGGVSYDLTYGLGSNYGWYHIVVTRLTNVMRLYVNGYLRAERTDLGVGELTGWGVPPDVFTNPNQYTYIGTGQTADVWASPGTDEAAIYITALTASRVLAHFEAALAVLPLSATIYVRFNVELDADAISPIEFPFTHNFANAISGEPNPLIEVISYKTNVNQSEPDYQQRVNAQPYHAERTLEYHVTSVGVQRARLQAALWTPGDVYPLPIANDWGQLTAQATAGASILSLDTTLRDYEVGSYVGVWGNIFDASTYQQFQITSVADTELGITPDVANTIPIGSPAMPARLACLPEDDLRVESHLIDRETAVLQFEILSTELSSRRITAYTPVETYKSIERFSLERAKVEWLDPAPYQIGRRMSATGTPTGNDYWRAIDTGSPQTVPIRVTLASRQAISEFYGWMDARQGKQNPVWVVSQDNDLNVLSRTGSPGTITITKIGYASRYNVHSARRDLAILKPDGSYIFKRITAAVDNGDGTETLTLDGDPPLFADITKVSFLKLCTVPDRFELRYSRNGSEFICECDFGLQELLTTPG